MQLGHNQKRTGAEVLADMLVGYGVSHVFMVPAVLRRTFAEMERRTKIARVHCHGEKAAAYMADGYARASNGLGLCFGIGGPGILNMATALAAAKADRTPVLAISGEVPRSWEGMGGFQDASGAGKLIVALPLARRNPASSE